MIVSIPWLKKFVNISESADEVAEVLTMLGHEAESVSSAGSYENIVTAKILEVSPHPNADKLKLCKVDAGDEILSIVCGAPNVAEGQIVPLARIGAVLPGDFKIKKSKIRGEVSMGMLCSEKELSISDDHSGLMVLPDNTPHGIPVGEVLGNSFESVEFDITPNRPDALSHYGIARDYAAKKKLELKPLENTTGLEPEKPTEEIKIKLKDPVGCPRYVAGIVKGVKVGPSPKWMVDLLESAGQRSINNIVDISNFILMEMGHPTHIFDFKQFSSGVVEVRKAFIGEMFTTLDGDEHKLDDRHLLITDGGNPVALAGVMGGLNSAVSDDTDTVLIESAYFDPITIRKSSKSLGMLTEASRRFERGADPDAAMKAFWMIVKLLEEVAGGKLVSKVVDAYPDPIKNKSITLRLSELVRVAGFNISRGFVSETLSGLGLEPTEIDLDSWVCDIPGFRPDLEREIDLIEEIIRVYGFDNVPNQVNYTGVLDFEDLDPRKELLDIYSRLTGFGYYQTYNNSLQSEKVAAISGVEPVKMINPLNQQMGTLRTSLFPGLIENLNYNVNNGTNDLSLFESGQVHMKKGEGLKGLIEISKIAGVVIGHEIPGNIHNEKGRKASFYTVKGQLSILVEKLSGDSAVFKEGKHPYFDNCISVYAGKVKVGYAGRLKKEILKSLKSDVQEILGFELESDSLLKLIQKPKSFDTITPFPGIERDLNFVMDDNVPSDKITTIIWKNGGPWLKKVTPVNLFKHESLGEGKKSIVYRMYFQHDSRTLEDKDVTSVIGEIIGVAGREIGAKLRA